MKAAFRTACVALCLICLVVPWPAAARNVHGHRVLGVIVQTDKGRLDNDVAQMGANVYSCDKLETDPNGVLRVKVTGMASQLFLSSTSLAALEDDGSAIQALAMGGSIGFSVPAAENFSVRTPAGVIRATGNQAVSGQVTYEGPQKLLISSIHGDLTLDTGGEFRTIPDGKSAEITFDNNIDNSCHDGAAAPDQSQVKPYVRSKIGFYLIAGGAAGIPAYFLWRDTTESQSKTNQ